jgi:hypothetical protein
MQHKKIPEVLDNNGSYRKYLLDARYVSKPHTRNFHTMGNQLKGCNICKRYYLSLNISRFNLMHLKNGKSEDSQ